MVLGTKCKNCLYKIHSGHPPWKLFFGERICAVFPLGDEFAFVGEQRNGTFLVTFVLAAPMKKQQDGRVTIKVNRGKRAPRITSITCLSAERLRMLGVCTAGVASLYFADRTFLLFPCKNK